MSDRFSRILSFIYFWGKKHQYQFSIFQSTECIPFLEKRHCVTTVCIFKVLFQHSNWRIGISICQKWKVGIDFCYIGFQDSWGLWLLFNYICLHNMIQHVWYLIPVNDCNTQNCKPHLFAWGKSSQGSWEPRCCIRYLSLWSSHQMFLVFHFLYSLHIDHQNYTVVAVNHLTVI